MTESFTCPRCGMVSHNPTDVREGYCGFCHDWTHPDVVQEILDECGLLEDYKQRVDQANHRITPDHVRRAEREVYVREGLSRATAGELFRELLRRIVRA